jgi:transposase-like protein
LEEVEMGKRYTPKFKFQVVLELLRGDKSSSQVARAYGVHPNTIGVWKQAFLEQGAEVFAKDGSVAEYERRIRELEQLIGKKEVEIALLKNFLGQRK